MTTKAERLARIAERQAPVIELLDYRGYSEYVERFCSLEMSNIEKSNLLERIWRGTAAIDGEVVAFREDRLLRTFCWDLWYGRL